MRRLVIIPLVACLVLGAFPGLFAQEAQPGKSEEDNGYAQISIFAKTLELLRQDYVDENKTSYHDLVTAAMKGMLSALDPHSQFMDPSDFRDMQDDTRSRFNGLGIEVSMKNGLPTVITAMEDTPAAKAGILSGDQILRINGISTERMDLQDAINVLRGPTGRKVTLTLLRPSTKEIKDYTLERAEIKVQSVKGVRSLYAQLTGPVKDLHRAILVGETTFGEGSVQNVMQLPDGSAVRFTTAKYYTPGKQVIQGNGVTPNIRVAMTAEQERALFALRNAENVKPEDEKSIIKAKDPQMLRAIDALKGVMIYAQKNAPKAEAVKK